MPVGAELETMTTTVSNLVGGPVGRVLKKADRLKVKELWRSRKECREQANVGASEATLGDGEYPRCSS